MTCSISSRENWLRFLGGKSPQWMPIFSETKSILPSIVPDNVARGLVIEAQPVPESAFGGPDMYGTPWIYEPLAGGSMEDPDIPPILTDIEDWPQVIRFPDIDSWDWEGAALRNRDFLVPDRLRTTIVFTGLFERLISFMGFESAAMALVDEDYAPELHALLDKMADINIHLIGNYKKYFDIDLVYFHDDWGAQRAPFFSLDTCMRMLVPHLKKIVDYCHSNGIYFDLHSCGHNDILVPAMIAAGADAWCGQPMCDKFALWEKYGDKIAIGMSFNAGSTEELYQQIDNMVDKIRLGVPEKRMYVRDRSLAKELTLNDYVIEKTQKLYK